ncbi:MAG: hypothetical protein H0U74_09245 [Bradymonadaceae bacterium]|nr:hypothetical protein [Lujinxingiaceae bacterium]
MPLMTLVSERRLNAARLVGANTFALVAQLVVHMPSGYFGAADEVTLLGGIYAAFLLLSTALGTLGQFRAWSWSTRFIPLVLSVNIGIFIAPMMTSPIISSIAIIWNLVVLLGFVFPSHNAATIHKMRDRHYEGDEQSVRWLSENGRALRHLLTASLILTTAVVGYEVSGQLLATAATLALNIASILLSVPMMLGLFRQGYRVAILVALPILVILFFLGSPAIVLLLLAFYQIMALTILLFQGQLSSDLLDYFFEYPALLLLAAFAALTLLGTLLLSFPAASATGVSISAVDAFFTATSAACITGLIVLDTPTDFSLFGHVVIIILIQLGGMGIMVISTFATLILGSRLGLRAEKALEEVLDLRGSKNAYKLTVFIVSSTLLIELVGAIFLSVGYHHHGHDWPQAIWYGVFHAISAFCHAGFALQSDSIMMFREDPFALMVFSALIVLGSIGFIVLAALWQWFQGDRQRLGLHARVVGIATVVFIVLGIVLFAICEWNASMADLGLRDKFMNAVLQSVTLRSAGFNSVDVALFHPATILFMMFFMFVGGAPGSAGGGIKLTTFVILIAAIRGIALGQPRVVLFKRQIPQDLVYRAAAITVISMLIGLSLLFVLLLTQPLPFEVLAFEAISAIGTVGLSLGATPQLNAFGKLVVILVIFIGRIGPLALALTLGQGKPARIGYPEARIMVG